MLCSQLTELGIFHFHHKVVDISACQAIRLLTDQLPNRLPRLEIPHMLVATPAEILVAEKLLRKKRKLPETQQPSPCWNILLTNAEKKPLVQVLLWFWEFLFGDFALD